jgi:succinate dehydrogenase/fumarate reductase flavoprotein subunit
LTWVHTLVLGSGAAGLAAAVRLRAEGVEDVLIVTEGLDMGTSINTGSDKQTYYKLSMCGKDADAPAVMAQTYFSGGSMHGDLALVEASLSARAFIHLVNLGVPFPRDAYGQFVGYKTDHDPRQRATSIGPYTSREMCRALTGQCRRLGMPIREGLNAVQLFTVDDAGGPRIGGAIVLTREGQVQAIAADNVVFAVGGPGGLYKTSVYPPVHTGAIGLALLVGAKAQSLPESQYGMASIRFRWNVSGTYMQVIPRFVSTAADGTDEREFLADYFDTAGRLGSQVFLKGYQWPFDSRKAVGGSSIVDILVYVETVLRGRRVFLDFRRNPAGFRFEDLSPEARDYLTRSKALQAMPIERLRAMNPGAIELYADHGIDLSQEPLEIAVCAQHNNGGLAGNSWWESTNIKHLFPVGEVNGSHGVYRPGGSALNAGQVGAFRAAEYIAHRYVQWSLPRAQAAQAAQAAAAEVLAMIDKCRSATTSWQEHRETIQQRMTRSGAHIRSADELEKAVAEAWRQFDQIDRSGCSCAGPEDLAESLRNRQLCFAHAVYLEAVLFSLQSGVGSRGSAMVLDPAGVKVHDRLDDSWRIAPENPDFRGKVQETVVEEGSGVSLAGGLARRVGDLGIWGFRDSGARGQGSGEAAVSERRVHHQWVDCRPLPESDVWFETAWARFRNGEVYDNNRPA